MLTASATTVRILHSRQVRYKNDKSVEQAINELYQKADELYGYHIGDEIQVNGIDFYVISDSPASQDYVVALKAEPLTVEEVNTYGGVGTENNRVNLYGRPTNPTGRAVNDNGYGGMFYYTSETCGYTSVDVTVSTGCTNDYNDSDVKYVVDNWSQNKFQGNELKTVDGYSARLVSISDLEDLGYVKNKTSYPLNDNVPNWVYNYTYWTMSSSDNFYQWFVVSTGQVAAVDILYRYAGTYKVRPVINVYKSAIQRVNNN